MTIREFTTGIQMTCEAGHRISGNREPVEHGIVDCRHTRGNEAPCGALFWVLRLRGARRLAVSISEVTAQRIRQEGMSAHQVLDMLGLIQRPAACSGEVVARISA